MDPITSEHGECAERADGTHCECWWDGGACCLCGAYTMIDDGSVCPKCHGDDECICRDLGLCCDDGGCSKHMGEGDNGT